MRKWCNVVVHNILVCSSVGTPANEQLTVQYSRLSPLHLYSMTLKWIRCRLSVSILRACVMSRSISPAAMNTIFCWLQLKAGSWLTLTIRYESDI